MRQDDRNVAKKLGVPDWNMDILRTLKEWLESERSGVWLSVYDSADDIDFLYAKEYGRLQGFVSHDPIVALS